jgi:hypothetical protein
MAGSRRGVGIGLALAVVLAAIAWIWLRSGASKRAPGKPTSSSAGSGESEPLLTRARERDAEPSPAPESPRFAPPKRTTRDKELREQARQRILEALARQTPEPAPPAPAPLPVLDKDYIQSRIRDDFVPMAKECYEAALARDGGLGGKMVFQFAIVGDESVGGIVESAELDPSSTLSESELVTCMRESLLSVTFVPPPHGGRVTVTYPFVLTPGDD